MRAALSRKTIGKRILKDFMIGICALVLFAAAVSCLRFLAAMILLVLYAVGLLAIFALRRLDELRSLIVERNKIETRVYETQKMESLARMATGIAHDFNNLLMAIIGYCDIALDKVGSGDQVRGDLMEIKDAGNRASSLAQRLLTFGRKKKSDTDPLDINEVISDLKPLLQHLVGKNTQLDITLQPDLWEVKADLTQIEEILVNLVLNAHDAMAEGGQVTIETSAAKLNNPDICNELGIRAGNYVKLSVADSGCGIDPQTKACIFDAFFSTKEKGTGLGLSMVSGIVKQSGGYIKVKSEPGQGTIFDIYLRAEKEQNEKKRGREEGNRRDVAVAVSNMNFRKVFENGSFSLNLRSTTKEGVIAEMVDMMVASGQIKNRDAALDAVLQREKVMSTGMQHGIALPHGKTSTVDGLVVAFAMKRDGVDFDSIDGQTSKIFVMTVSSTKRTGPHVQYLSEICKLLNRPLIKKRLLEAGGVEEVIEILGD